MSVEAAALHVKVGADTREAEAGLARVGNAARALVGVAGPVGTAMGGVFDLIGSGAKLALAPVQLLGSAFNLVTAPVRILTGAVGGLIGEVGKMAVGFALGTVAARGLEVALRAGEDVAIGFNARLEQSQMKWQTFLGGARDDAEAMLFHMQRLAAVTPFDYEGIEKGYSLLRAYGFALQELDPWLRRLGNASAAVGEGTQGIERLAIAIGQVRAAGQLRGQEVLQLTGMGVPVWEMLGDYLGKSPGQIRAMQEAGEISAQAFESAFTRWIESKGDLMGALNQTLTGAWSTIKDTVVQGGALAFRPLFDLVSSGAQSLAQWLQTDDFMTWAAKVNAATSLVVEGLRELAPIVAGVVSDVLGLLWDLASGAAEALSYLNPFAEHSPSLVSQVDEGVRQILDKYGLLRDVATPFKAGSDEMKRALADQRAGVDLLKDALDRAKSSLDRWKDTPIQGEGAAEDRLFKARQQINRAELRLTELQLANAGRSQIDAARKDVDRLQMEYRRLELQTSLRFDPQRRAIDKAASDRPGEQPASAIVAGIRAAKDELAKLTPVYDAHRQVLEAMDQAQKEAAASANALAGAGGTKPKDDTGFLGRDKEKLEQWKKDLQQFRDDFKAVRDFMDGIVAGAERLRAILKDTRQYGLVGGLSQLLYPTEYGLTGAERQRNEQYTEFGKGKGVVEPHFLAPPTYQDWPALADRVFADLSKALDEAWQKHLQPWGAKVWGALLGEANKAWQNGGREQAEKIGLDLGNALLKGIESAFQSIDWVGLLTGHGQREPKDRKGLTETLWNDIVAQQRRPSAPKPGGGGSWGLEVDQQRKFENQVVWGNPAGFEGSTTKYFWDWLWWMPGQPLPGQARDHAEDKAKELAGAVGAGLEKGLSGKETDVARATEGLVDRGIFTPAMGKLEIRSPSRVAADWGENVALGLVTGLQSEMAATATAVKAWLERAVLDPLGTAPSRAYLIGTNIARGLQDGVADRPSVNPERSRDPYDFPKKRALGGWVSAGESVVVGEERAEVFTPGTSGYVHPAVAAGPAPSLTVHVGQINARDPGEAYEIGQSFGEGLVAAWRQVSAQGGQFPLGLTRSA